MMQTKARTARAALLAAIALSAATACGAPSREPAVQPTPAATPAPGEGAQGDEAAMARARADSLRRPYTEADVRFMQHMIAHHAQAIRMAAMAPTHDASAQVRTLAARIANGQRDEIGTMVRWLRDRGKEVPEADLPDDHAGGAHRAGTPPAATHQAGTQHAGTQHAGTQHAGGHDAGHGAGHDAPMPGMLTEAEMRELDAARGRQFDRLFLTYMIKHHRGAIVMVNELFGSYGAGQDETVFRLATDVNVDQITEIARMERMLLTLAIEGMSQ